MKTKHNVCIFVAIMLITSCSKQTSYISIHDGHAVVSAQFAENLQEFRDTFPTQDQAKSGIPFTLNPPFFNDFLVINLSVGGDTFLFNVDTGADLSVFFAEPTNAMSVTSIKGHDAVVIPFQVSEQKYPLLTRLVSTPKEVTGIDNPVEIGFDGIIGMPFLKMFDNVVFDFQKNLILLNQPAISETDIPFIYDDVWNNKYLKPLIPITIDGSKELGIIDTGAAEVILRENFGDGNTVIPAEELIAFVNNLEPIEFIDNKSVTVQSVLIGDVEICDVQAFYWNDSSLIGNDRATRVSKYINFFGLPFWKDHVIQLDFVNNVFRIK